MSPVLVAMMALAASPSEGKDAVPSAPAVVSAREPASAETPAGRMKEAAVVPRKTAAPRTGAKLREAVRAALRRWAQPTDAEADAAAREFLFLYRELEADDRLARSQRQYFKRRLRIRLAGLSDQIARRIARRKRLADDRASAKGGTADAPSPAGDADGPGATSPDPGATAAPGGPAFGPGPFQMPDHGQALIDLIQTVIRPETWDVHGGRGTIYYWYPGRALVIRQTDEVHEQIGGVLDQLRRAGR